MNADIAALIADAEQLEKLADWTEDAERVQQLLILAHRKRVIAQAMLQQALAVQGQLGGDVGARNPADRNAPIGKPHE